LTHMLERQFGYRVEQVAPGQGSVVRRIDREKRVVTVSPGLSAQAAKSERAATAGLLVLDAGKLHERLVAEARRRHAETERLIKIHLANYFAGALLLPYDDFYREAQRTR